MLYGPIFYRLICLKVDVKVDVMPFFFFLFFTFCSVLWCYAIRMVEVYTPFNSKPPGRFGTYFWKRLISHPPTHHVLWSIRHGNRKTREEVRLYTNICSLLGCFPNCKNVRENMKKMCTICLEEECFIFYANVSFFFHLLFCFCLFF